MAKIDISKLKRELRNKERQLCKARKDLERLETAKGDLISTVSHELRTPLSIIKEGIDLTLDEVGGTINQKQKQFLMISRNNVNKLSQLVSDILDISKIEAKKVALKKSLVNLDAFIKNIVMTFRKSAGRRGITIGYKLPSKKTDVFIDTVKISQVLHNLISNAVKFVRKGGRIMIVAEETPQAIQINVCDNGIGISKYNLNKLFDKFVQLGTTLSHRSKGTGLGLAISKGLVELHGGRIWAESRLGKGSTFSFTIPKASFEEIFREYAKYGIDEAQDAESAFSIIVSRIDNFEELKKKYGILKSYLYLEALTGVIWRTLRKSADTVLRDSGECAIMLPGTDKKGAIAVEQRIREAMAHFILSKKMNREVDLSFGSATYPQDARDSVEMIARARAFFEGLYFGKERRSSERMYARLHIEFVSARPSGGPDRKRERVQTINVSRGGLCIFSNTRIRQGRRLELLIRFPQKKRTIKALAKTVWIKKVDKLTGFAYKMGLRYEKIDPEDLSELMRLVSRQG